MPPNHSPSIPPAGLNTSGWMKAVGWRGEVGIGAHEHIHELCPKRAKEEFIDFPCNTQLFLQMSDSSNKMQEGGASDSRAWFYCSLKTLYVSMTSCLPRWCEEGRQGARENKKFRKGNVLHILGDDKIEFLGPPPAMCPSPPFLCSSKALHSWKASKPSLAILCVEFNPRL